MTTAVIYYYLFMATDALRFARVVARVAYYIINTTKCATAACCSTRAPDADDVVNLDALLLPHTTYICGYSRDSVAS